MARPRLFVRSTKANVVVGYNAGSYYTKAHSLTKTEYKLSPMDGQAKDILTKKGIDFELVDLSRGLKASLIARVRGIGETPTLQVETGPIKGIVGLKAISDWLGRPATKTQN